MTCPRSHIGPPDQVGFYHVVSRCGHQFGTPRHLDVKREAQPIRRLPWIHLRRFPLPAIPDNVDSEHMTNSKLEQAFKGRPETPIRTAPVRYPVPPADDL